MTGRLVDWTKHRAALQQSGTPSWKTSWFRVPGWRTIVALIDVGQVRLPQVVGSLGLRQDMLCKGWPVPSLSLRRRGYGDHTLSVVTHVRRNCINLRPGAIQRRSGPGTIRGITSWQLRQHQMAGRGDLCF